MKFPTNNDLDHAMHAKSRYDEKKKMLYRLYMVTKHILTEGEHPYFTKYVTTGDP